YSMRCDDKVVTTDRPTGQLELRAYRSVDFVFGKPWRVLPGSSTSQFSSDDDARANPLFADNLDSFGYPPLRVLGSGSTRCWCRSSSASDLDFAGWLVRDLREFLLDQLQGLQQSEQRARRDRFDNQLVSVFAHVGIIARQFELTWNSDRLVAPVLDMSRALSEPRDSSGFSGSTTQ
ncbi:MAG TPA: hypothetical protein VI653_27830, partial [Steroidobacteraceae bacterium]